MSILRATMVPEVRLDPFQPNSVQISSVIPFAMLRSPSDKFLKDLGLLATYLADLSHYTADQIVAINESAANERI